MQVALFKMLDYYEQYQQFQTPHLPLSKDILHFVIIKKRILQAPSSKNISR